MAILNHKKTYEYISNWIKEYAAKAGIKTLIVGLSGGVDSALVALLCSKTGLPTLCINMPCHSSNSAYQRASSFAEKFKLNLTKVDLSTAHEVILSQAQAANFPVIGNLNNPIAVGGLRSCLRAPVLSYFANAYKGIIVGTGNRSEDNITRYFQKYGDGCVDISPISDLFKSEVYELFAYLTYLMDSTQGPNHKSIEVKGNRYILGSGARAILEAKPTADLWGPDAGQEDEKELGISYDEIEWADREDTRTAKMQISCQEKKGIIFSEEDPAIHPEFFRYTGRQQQVIAKLHQLEKISRHKFNESLPCCKIRDIEGLVR